MLKFFVELRRRSVFRVAGGYAVLAWLLIQLAIALEATLLLPAWFDSGVTVLLILGFPVAVILAWAFEMTPQGIKRTDYDPDADPDHEHLRLRVADGVIAIALVALVGLTTWNLTRETPRSVEVPLGEVAASALTEEPERTVPEGPSSIAVLPFADMSAAQDQAYFSDGIAEEILNALVRIDGLRVAGRTSAFAFKGSERTLSEIGETLNVGHILEGSVRKDGDRVRITATLIEADTGFNLWSDTFNETLDNVWDTQEQIARAVARELKGMMTESGGERLADQLTDDPVAYDLFLRGRDLVNQAWGIDTLPRAVLFLQQAVERDPEFVAAWELLSYANFLLPTYSRVQSQDPYMATAEEAARKVIALEPTDPAGHSLIASLRLADNRFAEALKRSALVRKLGPDDPEANYGHGYRLSVIGNSRDALPLLDEALDANPSSGLWLNAQAVARLNAGDLEGARQSAERSFELGFPGAAFIIGDIMLIEGKKRAAYDYLIEAYDSLSYIAPEFADRDQWVLAGRALYLEEKPAQALALRRVTEARAAPEIAMSTSIMNALLSMGEAELFMEAFEAEPYANGSYVLSRLWDGREATTKIRTHPDFPQWADQVGLVEAWQQFGWPEKCTPRSGTDGSDGQFTCV
ncbi:hypothetical protein HK107_07290 [Parvularcula sp. ZS-1/3]|uniref:Tetratricopeptide repeat protein n=1 Tax=Parvularcula mediterranea TaxID=2732508 RepID=A0A7Y3RL62_9PROT|nr:hypothetical protein [Parvularcula mediterranea]NNU16124.1 hypothetical protein [Parvularcula mediterranea]